MHSATLYHHDKHGRRDATTPLARVIVDDDANVEVRMEDGTVLVAMSLEQLGYVLMWQLYPITSPSVHAPITRILPVKRVHPE